MAGPDGFTPTAPSRRLGNAFEVVRPAAGLTGRDPDMAVVERRPGLV